jgi:hypothetical protein
VKNRPAKGRKPGDRPLTRLLPPAVLAAATVALFLDVLLGRRFLWDDVLYFYYPYHYYLFAGLRGLHLPLWNPYVFAGTPFIGDVQSGAFYPLNWLLAAVSSSSQGWVYWLVELKAVLHVFGAGCFAYLLGRELKLGRAAALVTGLVFGLGGFFETHTVHLTLVSALAWLPLVLLFEIRSFERHSLRYSASAGLAFGAACLAGHPQAALMIGYAVVLHRLWFVAAGWKAERQRIGFHLASLGLCFAVGLLVSAAAYLPALDNARWTVRAALGWNDAVAGSLPPTVPLLLLVPKFFGSIAGGVNDTVRYWGGAQRFLYWETCAYVGVLPLVLAKVGSLGRVDRRRLFWVVLGILALLLALGRLTPLHWLAYHGLPGFSLFRVPARLAGLFALAAAVLAGFGLDDLLGDPARARRWLKWLLAIAGLGAVAVGLLATGALRWAAKGLAEPDLFANALRQSGIALALLVASAAAVFVIARRPAGARVSAVLAVGLVLLDLVWFGWNFSRGSLGPDEYYARNSLVTKLEAAARRQMFRVESRSGDVTLLRANQGMLGRVELLDGFTPLKLADFAALDRLDPSRRADLLNAVWRVNVNAERGFMTVDTNPQALPRARVYHQWIARPDPDSVLAWLADSGFDIHRVLLLETEPGIAARSGGTDSVALTERSSDRLRLSVITDSGGVLLLSEVYHPRWRARVDGKPAALLRADAALRAVALEPGRHEVELTFDPGPLRLGIPLSVAGLVLGLAVALARRKTA